MADTLMISQKEYDRLCAVAKQNQRRSILPPRSVWITHQGNYYPRQLTGIYATQELAVKSLKRGEEVEEWVVTEVGR